MPLDLFAGIPMSDYEAAKAWYVRLLGAEPSFSPHATEAVWELAEHRYLFINGDADRAGRAIYRDSDGNEISFGGAIE
jgi:catechol 2,3-dioxygenase-like lactoylglutathione lyase family enzyme